MSGDFDVKLAVMGLLDSGARTVALIEATEGAEPPPEGLVEMAQLVLGKDEYARVKREHQTRMATDQERGDRFRESDS